MNKHQQRNIINKVFYEKDGAPFHRNIEHKGVAGKINIFYYYLYPSNMSILAESIRNYFNS